MGRFNTQIGSYDSSSQAKSILKGIKEGVAEALDPDTQRLEQEVIPAGNISRYNISEQELNRIKHLSGLN